MYANDGDSIFRSIILVQLYVQTVNPAAFIKIAHGLEIRLILLRMHIAYLEL